MPPKRLTYSLALIKRREQASRLYCALSAAKFLIAIISCRQLLQVFPNQQSRDFRGIPMSQTLNPTVLYTRLMPSLRERGVLRESAPEMFTTAAIKALA